ncbi:MAG: HD domain-containing protein [Alphaproteobacteria bacterium]|nr:HD domain-containing protein [Alphaproteobacteria bacterium]
MPFSLRQTADHYLVPAFETAAGVLRNWGLLSDSELQRLILEFRTAVGSLGNFAVRKNMWMTRGRNQVALGNLDPFHFALMTSALVSRHQHSGFNYSDYLDRVTSLILSDSIEDVMMSADFRDNRIFDKVSYDRVFAEYTRVVEALSDRESVEGEIERLNRSAVNRARIEVLLIDIEAGTSYRENNSSLKPRITAADMQEIFRAYKSRIPANDDSKQGALNRDPKSTYAFEHRVILPIIRELFAQGKISEEQVVLLLSANYHAKERRNSSNLPAITHACAVYKVIDRWAIHFGFKPEEIRLMKLAALIHDIGEKTNFVMAQHLKGIVSDDLVQLVNLVHKESDELYFDEYVGAKCRFNKMAAFIKLCDIWHNSLDIDPSNPKFKQAYTYPIAANYLLYVLQCEDEDPVSLDDFVVREGMCNQKTWKFIKDFTHHNHKVAVSEVAANIPLLENLIPIQDIFTSNPHRVTHHYAHLCREKDSSLHSRPDV